MSESESEHVGRAGTSVVIDGYACALLASVFTRLQREGRAVHPDLLPVASVMRAAAATWQITSAGGSAETPRKRSTAASWLTAEQASDALAVTPRQVRNMRDELGAVREGREWRFDAARVAAEARRRGRAA